VVSCFHWQLGQGGVIIISLEVGESKQERELEEKKKTNFLEEKEHQQQQRSAPHMSALFNFQSFLVIVLLLICTCAYIRERAPALLDRNKEGAMGVFWKAARIGERASGLVAVSMAAMSLYVLFTE